MEVSLHSVAELEMIYGSGKVTMGQTFSSYILQLKKVSLQDTWIGPKNRHAFLVTRPYL